ncbi:MAG TPA: UDP-4-amino-4,6-dideoxy-N-acetyl-beta-L-altrosamine transaminase [Stellaceae bacterium]
MIPYGRQSIDDSDIDAVVRVLRSPMLTQGEAVPSFEKALAATVGAPHAVAVTNATSALHIACVALGLGPGDRLWTVPNTFVASANAGIYCGAAVDFVDIDPRSYNMDVDALEAKLAATPRDRLPKIVVPVHFAGQSCEMDRIAALAARYGFRVIEDASHAVGAEYEGEPVGNCRYADIAVFSFHPVKIVTTGEGGMCLTRDAGLADRLRRLRSHGITKDPALCDRPLDGDWDYRQIELGFNYRMTDIQAALGEAQVAKLSEFLARRRELAARYDTLLSNLPVVAPWQHPDTRSSWHLYVIQVPAGTRRQVFDRLRGGGIGVQVLYIPVHRQPYYERLGFRAGQFPVAEAYYARSFTLPMFPALTNSEQDQVVEVLAAALEGADAG